MTATKVDRDDLELNRTGQRWIAGGLFDPAAGLRPARSRHTDDRRKAA